MLVLKFNFTIYRTYRSTNVKEPGEISAPSANLNTAFRLIKDIQKTFRTREQEEKEKADLVQQDTLVLGTGKIRQNYIMCVVYQRIIN